MRLNELLTLCNVPYDPDSHDKCGGWMYVPEDIRDELTSILSLLGYVPILGDGTGSINNCYTYGKEYLGHSTPDKANIAALSMASGSDREGDLYVHEANIRCYLKSIDTGEAHEPV